MSWEDWQEALDSLTDEETRMSDYCLRFNAAAMEVHDLTEENGRLQKRIAELEALLRGELVEMDEAQSIEYLRGYAHGMANPR